jgi:hypothetical protein
MVPDLATGTNDAERMRGDTTAAGIDRAARGSNGTPDLAIGRNDVERMRGDTTEER